MGTPRSKDKSSKQMLGHNDWRDVEKEILRDNKKTMLTRDTVTSNNQQRKFNVNNTQKFHPNYSRALQKSSKDRSFFQLTRLLELMSLSSDEIMSVVVQKEAEFEKLINNDMSSDTLVLTMEILTRVCRANFTEIITRVLSQVCSDNFLKNLENFLMKLSCETPGDKINNVVYHKNKDRFWNNVSDLFAKTIELIPRMACNKLIPIAQRAVQVMKILEASQSYKIDPKIKEKSSNVVKHLDQEMQKIRGSKSTKGTSSSRLVVEEDKPPENFRMLSVVPTLDDLHDENPFFRACMTKDAYDSIEHYLDVQFRLLREDFLIPLRNGLYEYLNKNANGGHRNSDLRIYRQAKLMSLDIRNNHIGNKLAFGNIKNVDWSNSKRFMFGSLLLLSRDNFQTVLFATVTGCDLGMLSRGHILIEPCHGSKITPDLLKSTFVVLESKIFFEPYFQVLTAMQNIRDETFPMEDYLIRAQIKPELPRYLMRYGVTLTYKESHKLPVGPAGGAWPTAKQLDMDESQYKAFKSAITQEFAIVQGPPGTGKTFLALQIVRVLLENKDNWREHGPIVVVCLTNHALDQFLEEILKYTNSVVRAGSRSKSEILVNYTLMKRREALGIKSSFGKAMFTVKKEFEEILAEIKRYRLLLKYLTTPNIIVPLACLFPTGKCGGSDAELIYELTGFDINLGNSIQNDLAYDNQQETGDDFYDYLVERDLDEELNAYTDDDIAFDYEKINFYHVESTNVMGLLDIQIRFLRDRIDTLVASEAYDLDYFVYNEVGVLQYHLEILTDTKFMLKEEFNNHPLLNDSRQPSRYDHWEKYWERVKFSYEYLEKKVLQLEEQCRQKKSQLNKYRECANLEVLKEHDVIGLTTSCAAKLQESLRTLSAPIVIVEEAAEILEAHVVCSITKECQHVILIGDHKQLRPKASVYELGIRYNLNVSLFERMVNIRGECLQLAYQHRMRPEISKLITPSIYTTLYNHEVVRDFPNVKGVARNVFFIDHENSEQSYNDDTWMNLHEVKYLLAFAKYLILQGYESSEITILCTYSGQLFTFKKEVRNHQLLHKVNITTVDNYQGEENKIILLSLVRNNGAGNVGFLKEENRVCVALSRAKYGLYVMGNMRDLVVKNNIWPKINRVLEEDEAIGDGLIVKCQVHSDQVFKMKTADDFKQCPRGGCSKICDVELKCGHSCVSVCHILDREHEKYKCLKNCEEKCPKGHQCLLKCWEGCNPCKVKIPQSLPCGHTVDVPCYEELKRFKCPVIVSVTLPDCNHRVRKPCHESIKDCECTHYCESVLSCGHTCGQRCSHDKHLQFACFQSCTKKSVGCQSDHTCQNRCFEDCRPCSVLVSKLRSCGHRYDFMQCSKIIEDEPCVRPCLLKLTCGHKCKKSCDVDCGLCTERCDAKCPHHQCNKHCGDPCKPCLKLCQYGCRHQRCTRLCNEPCDIEPCDEPCERTLKCGHPCIGFCGELCPPLCRICNKNILSEDLLGTEDYDDARFILLPDCQHCIESERLLKSVTSTGTRDRPIQAKCCPKCEVPIKNCMRLMNQTKEDLSSLVLLRKKIFFNNRKEADSKRQEYLAVASTMLNDTVVMGCAHLKSIFERLEKQGKALKNRRNPVSSYYEISAFKNILDVLVEMTFTLKLLKNASNYKFIENQIKLLTTSVPITLQLSKQRLEDVQLELRRLHLMVKIKKIFNDSKNRFVSFMENVEQEILIHDLTSAERFSKKMENEIITRVKRLHPNENNLLIERKVILKDVGLVKGHWFECPKGHFYEVTTPGYGRCLECK
ncbi:NFX1-type zinc finger-containing protein 1-like isoform X2 [Copidosoma floridanum]|uniref:NFX1-type zinc finger-containing protein 1-like isoform X2 n=1 Tax=Copidosoma floridanum TaxID=29053 RepID=UPI000C6F993D|nr:NFX1-type zinc finger-containing protein 1-like isoform X2 [Copidosoma floridanum]